MSPSAPSSQPPAGTESTCEPTITKPVLLARQVGPHVAGRVGGDLDRQLLELAAHELARLDPLVGPGHAARAAFAAGQVGQLAQVGENAIGVHQATAAVAPSERGTKRPCPGCVTIWPRS